MNRGVIAEPYHRDFSKSAIRTMRRLPENVCNNVHIKLAALAADPMAANNNVSALKGEPGFRLRVGDWRVLYDIDHSKRRLRVLDVRPRGDAYKP